MPNGRGDAYIQVNDKKGVRFGTIVDKVHEVKGWQDGIYINLVGCLQLSEEEATLAKMLGSAE